MELQWHDVSTWGVEGKGWSETRKFYDRLPARAEGVVRPEVWDLSRMATGMAARFETDAREIHARWRLTLDRMALPHMPASACSGVDLYAEDHGQMPAAWRWVASSKPESFPEVEQRLVGDLDSGERSYMLYLPLFNGVESLEIGVPRGSGFTPVPPRGGRPIVYYGTSIAHGASASRPGMTHVAILGRRLDVPILNLGFSGNGRMEPEVATFLAELDASLFVVDCLPNMDGALVGERAEEFVRILRKRHPDTPIVLVEDRTYANARWVKSLRDRHEASRRALRTAYQHISGGGDEQLVYVKGEGLLGKDGEDTVDSSHPTDLGFVRLADALQSVLEGLLTV